MSSQATLRLISNGFKPVAVEDKNLISSFFKKENSNFSDYSFSVLYAWSAYKTLFYKRFEDTMLIARSLRGKIDLLYPPLCAGTKDSFNSAINHYASILQDIYHSNQDKIPGAHKCDITFKVLSIDESKLNLFDGLEVPEFSYKISEDLPDYIYDYQKLIDLSGKAYKNKRENINKFIRNYQNCSIEPIVSHNIPDLMEFLRQWYIENKPQRTIHISELFSTDIFNHEKNFVLESYQSRKMLRDFNKLGLIGDCIKIYSRVVGFIIGEQTNSDTFTVLIEKVNKDFFGLSQFLFREFLIRNVKTEFVNTSDDSGMPGLKIMKESYRPEYMKKRYFLNFFSH
jgi:hypothetical protein